MKRKQGCICIYNGFRDQKKRQIWIELNKKSIVHVVYYILTRSPISAKSIILKFLRTIQDVDSRDVDVFSSEERGYKSKFEKALTGQINSF